MADKPLTLSQMRDEISDGIDKLNTILDSDAYMEMLADLNTTPEVRNKLNAQWAARNKLVLQLLDVYGEQIKANDAKFIALTNAMKDVNKSATAAADGLKKIADRIQYAVDLAKAVDQAIVSAAALLS